MHPAIFLAAMKNDKPLENEPWPKRRRKSWLAPDRVLLFTVIILQAIIVYKLFAPSNATDSAPITMPGLDLGKRQDVAAHNLTRVSSPADPYRALTIDPAHDVDDFDEAEVRAFMQELVRIMEGSTANSRLSRMLERDVMEAQLVHRQRERIFNSILRDFQQFESFLNFDDAWPTLLPSPTLDMRDLENHYLVVFSLPGFNTDAVQLQLDGRILTLICGNEATPGTFYSGRVQLPGDIDQSRDAQARLTNGVLKVFIPKATTEIKVPAIETVVESSTKKEIL